MKFFKLGHIKSTGTLAWGIVLILLSLALFVRVSNLKGKFYWIDEVSSSFVITGHWPEYIDKEIEKNTGQIISIGQFRQALEQQPSSDTGQLISSLLNCDPQHSPLYFVLAQKWALIFGASPQSLRMISAILSFVGIPIFAWLCTELFGTFFFGIIGLSLIAIAPFPVLFSQQNREYGLWFTVCALSTALLLLANRKNNRYCWMAYGFSVAISLYTFLFSLPFLFSHLLFQWCERKSGADSRFNKFILCFGIGILAYAPWMINILLNAQKVLSLNDWSSKYLEPSLYLQGMILNFSRLFLDLDLPSFQPLPLDQIPMLISILITFAIIILSILVLLKRFSPPKRVLVVSMFAFPLLFLFSMDVFAGKGIHALVGRQLMPAWISVYLAVAFAIGLGLRSTFSVKRGIALSVLIIILSFETISIVSYIPQKHWWPLKPKALFDDAVAIESSNPELLVTSEIEPKQFISMSYSLRPDLLLLTLKDYQSVPNLDKIKKVALYRPSQWLLEAFKVDFNLEKLADDIWIARLKKRS